MTSVSYLISYKESISVVSEVNLCILISKIEQGRYEIRTISSHD